MNKFILYHTLTTLFSISLLFTAKCDIFYIFPSISQCASAETCMTLTQLATAFPVSSSVLTIMFHPGKHVLNTSNISFAGISHVSMTSNTTDNTRCSISCTVSSKFQFEFIGHVHINGLTFAGCLENEVREVGEFIMENCRLKGSEMVTGRALVVTNSTLCLKRSHIESFHSCGSINGGAIFASTSIINISDCLFANNGARIGAGLFALDSQVALIDSNFSKHNACNWPCNDSRILVKSINKSVVCRSDCILGIPNSFCEESFSLTGGILCVFSSNISVHSGSFIENSASNGVAVFCHKGANVNIVNSEFINNKAAAYGGVIYQLECHVSVARSNFSHNEGKRGGAVYCHKGANVIISDTLFMHNEASAYGGVIYQLQCDVNITRGNFSNNRGKLGGVVYHNSSQTANVLKLEDCHFYNNSAEQGGVTYISKSNVLLTECQFSNNLAEEQGGVLFLTSNTNATIINANFSNNRANSLTSSNKSIAGAIRAVYGSQIVILHFALFENNSAYYGAAIHLYKAKLNISATVLFTKNSASLGTLVTIHSPTNIMGFVSFTENTGSLFAVSSDILIKEKLSFIGHSVKARNNDIFNEMEGGCISLFVTTLYLVQGEIFLSQSSANNGGGILAKSSTLYIDQESKLSIYGCASGDTGGGMYLYHSKLYIKSTINISNNNATTSGGGIHAISSSIIFDVVKSDKVYLHLRSNSAREGGGACLELNSQFYLTQLFKRVHNGSQVAKRAIHLFNNSAEYGGAIYIADDTIIGTCSSGSHMANTVTAISQSECFFQIIAIRNNAYYTFRDAVSFVGNKAHMSGSLLFGGLLDRCTVRSLSKTPVRYSRIPRFADGIYDDTSSLPVRLCFCDEKNVTIGIHCSNERSKSLRKWKGETFVLKIVAVDQLNHPLNATVYNFLSNSTGFLGEEQDKVTIGNRCTELPFTVFSVLNHAELVLYADGPCRTKGISPIKIRIDFYPCECPAGFELSRRKKHRHSCVCICHHKLTDLSFMKDLKCNSTTLTLTRSKAFWISITTATFVVYEHCPLGYCLPALPPIEIHLNRSNHRGVDAQCDLNRSGTLCGQCQKGLTLSLGSSRCIECPQYWPVIFILIIIGSIIAGIILVGLILLSNLTVAAGTLNGVIFYANIFNSNQSLFMPFESPNFHTTFIAWLNLDVGFDVCFIKGINTYDKTWIQMFFPLYLILVVFAIKIACKYSVRLSRTIAPKNPIATLATLLLLSYTKLLNTVIATMSFAHLNYIPESVSSQRYVERVWFHDASVPYLRGKHIPLFITAIFVFLFTFVYTFLLLFWQCLVYLPNWFIFRWVRNTKLSSFMDAYHAPFTPSNRYWTGLLLLARVILYVTATVNISGEPSINLLSTSLVIGCIFLLQGYSGIRTYKKWPLNALEFTTYFNILAFSVAKFYVLLSDRSGDDDVIASVSVSVEFVLFLSIIVYHASIETNILHRIKQFKLYKTHFCRDLQTPFISTPQVYVASVTRSEVSFREQDSNMTEYSMKEKDDTTLLFNDGQNTVI